MTDKTNPLDNPLCFLRPTRHKFSAWAEHIPFGMYLIDMAQPRTLVELGTHHGVSYCAFCQAAQYLHLDAQFYAVDTWRGDAHSGFYDNEIFLDLRAFHDVNYSAFSRLLRLTFNEALGYFSDGSIDILHIDGYHTYEDTKQNFESWLPKMSHRGIVLFHDTNVRDREFGVWRLWEELREQYSHFEFIHGNGLGILAVGDEFPHNTDILFNASDELRSKFRQFFAFQGQRWRMEYELKSQGDTAREQLQQRDKQLSQQREQLQQRDKQLGEQQAQLQQRDKQLGEQQAQLQQRDRQLSEQRERLQQRDKQLNQQQSILSRQDKQVAEYRGEITLLTQQQGVYRLESIRLRRDILRSKYLKRIIGARNRWRWIKLRVKQQRKHLILPALFNSDWYKNQYLQGTKRQSSPYIHYLVWGWQKGFSPSPLFDSLWYLAQYDIDMEPLTHYLQYGWEEGRSPSIYFDVAWYLEKNQDVRAAGVEPLSHYLTNGWKEGRSPSIYFDVAWYLEKNQDVRAADVEPLAHYLTNGWKEGRSPSIYFDVTWYLEKNQDVRAAEIEPLAHYLTNGWKEGRNPSTAFSVSRYLQDNPDVEAVGMEPLLHYLTHGWKEGRNPSPNFDVRGYLRNNSDVVASHIEPLYHYLLYGRQEGRPADYSKQGIKQNTKRQVTLLEKFPYIPNIIVDHNKLINPPKVSIIVPIYNAYEYVLRCLQAVLQHTSGDVKLILINDNSPDERIAKLLEQYQDKEHITVVHNDENKGFTYTINRGIELAGNRDVILLNSDTEVGPRWVQNMIYAAYRSDEIGTVTAVSNNAGAFSVPEAGKANPIPSLVSNEDFARLLSQSTYRRHPKVPTGNGFCMYIKRSLIDDIGLFDVEAFPRGYGEENDFCMRAVRKGWVNVLDEATYIIHERTASFGEAKHQLAEAGRQIINQRYPEYTPLIRQNFNSEAIQSVRENIRNLGESAGEIKIRPRVLYVVSTKTGGTPQTNLDLMRAVQQHYAPFVLRCDKQKITVSALIDNEVTEVFEHYLEEAITFETHVSAEYDQVVYSVLAQLGIELMHIRHIAWHSLNLTRIANSLSIPIIFSFHDFYTVDPTVNLLNNNKQFSRENFLNPQGEQYIDLWKDATTYVPEKVYYWRARMEGMLQYCSAFVTTARSSQELLVEAFPFLRDRLFHIIPHGRDFETIRGVDKQKLPDVNEPLKVLVPGNIGYHKGYNLIYEIKGLDKVNQIEFHFLGLTRDKTIPGVYHGAYDREHFANIVQEIGSHLAVILSIWPETFCHTLTESLAAGLPVLVTDLGAQAERVRQDGGGWITPSLDPQEIYQILLKIRGDQDTYETKLDEVSKWQQRVLPEHTTKHMAAHYMSLYRRVNIQQRTSSEHCVNIEEDEESR